MLKTWQDCSPAIAWGVSIKITWCGTWNNGGKNGYGYMNAGSNYTISGVVEGWPISASHWDRVNVDTDGNYWATGG